MHGDDGRPGAPGFEEALPRLIQEAYEKPPLYGVQSVPSDLYAAGALLAHMTAGHGFYKRVVASPAWLLSLVLSGELQGELETAGVPPAVADLICCLMHEDPAERLSLEEALRRLELALPMHPVCWAA